MWSDLTMQQRADVISMAVKSGLRDMASIRKLYDDSVKGSGREYEEGGYLDWKLKASKYKHLDIDNDNTYDYEGWYNENPKRAWLLLKDSPDAHFSDKYKTVYHPTFSTQSKYSGVVDARFNPQGLKGNTWSEDNHVFTMSPDGYRGPVSMDERKWYLENAEDNGVQLREANGSLPIFDGIPWGGVLPNVTVTGKKFAKGGKKPVTTGGAGYVPSFTAENAEDLVKKGAYKYLFGSLPVDTIRQRLYDNITPVGYYDAVDRIRQAVKYNKREDQRGFMDKSFKFDDQGYNMQRDELWAQYLQIPKEKRHKLHDLYGVQTHLNEAKYTPTIGKTSDTFYSLNLPRSKQDEVVEEGLGLDYNTNKVITARNLKTFMPSALGNHLGNYTVGKGHDERGSYVSYYDRWDLDPFSIGNGDHSMGIGKPVNIYDRIYLDDYYKIKEPTHATYLPEVTVWGNKKAKGGSIHIESENRGKFGGGGFLSLIPMPMILPRNTEGGKKQRKVLQFLPVVGTAVNMEEAIHNPTKYNVGRAGISAASDLFGLPLWRGAKAGAQLVKEGLPTTKEVIRDVTSPWTRGEVRGVFRTGFGYGLPFMDTELDVLENILNK